MVTRKHKKIKKFMPSPLQKTGNGFCRAEACFFAHKFLTANYNLRKKRVFMNTLVIVLIAVVVLGLGYVLYGRHILGLFKQLIQDYVCILLGS